MVLPSNRVPTVSIWATLPDVVLALQLIAIVNTRLKKAAVTQDRHNFDIFYFLPTDLRSMDELAQLGGDVCWLRGRPHDDTGILPVGLVRVRCRS